MKKYNIPKYTDSPHISQAENNRLRKIFDSPGPNERKKRKKPEKKEHKVQVEFVEGLKKLGIDDYYAIPNGGHRFPSVAKELKEEGVREGIPDVCVFIPTERYHGLYLEIKANNTGYASKAQKIKIKRMNELGYCARVVKGVDNAIGLTKAYLTGREIEKIDFKIGYRGDYFILSIGEKGRLL